MFRVSRASEKLGGGALTDLRWYQDRGVRPTHS